MLQAFSLAYEPDPLVGPLFEKISLTVAPGERVFLTGRNGTGKTKLVEILAGVTPPTAGKVVMRDGATLAYLEQDQDARFPGELGDFLGETSSMRRLLAKLGITPKMLAQPYASLSHGERTRAHLARCLASDADILLLDEPTNHLDIEGRKWIERALADCRQGMLVVCHDRTTIDALATRVLELENGTLNAFTGGYTDMQESKARAHERQWQAYEAQRRETSRLLSAAEDTLERSVGVTSRPTQRTYDPKAKAFYAGKAGRMDKRAQAIRTRVEQARASHVEKPFVEKAIALEFTARPLRSAIPLAVRGIDVTFDRPVLRNLSLTMQKGSRIALVAPNGEGKSTLFRVILGELKPDRGEVTWSPDAHVAFLSQGRSQLDPDKTVLEALEPQNSAHHALLRTLLARLQVRRDAALRRIDDLSVGERTKVEIVWMLLSPANVLLLDEPTNHLDIASLEALENALRQFPGAVLFTSHDREFVKRVATDIVEWHRKPGKDH